MDLVVLVRLFCWLSAGAIVVARAVPVLQKRFLNYGARAQPMSRVDKQASYGRRNRSPFSLDSLASIDVPHAWFTHFYIVSFFSSLFWLVQVVYRSQVLRFLGDFVHRKHSETVAPKSLLCIILMALQSARRLWESHKFAGGSKSRMWFGHYVFGLAFYIFANIAVWIEGIHSILETTKGYTLWTTTFQQPSVAVGSMVFLLASAIQCLAHAHLASLPKYTLPQHWLFRRMVAPHYTAECTIYLALALLAAPEQQLFNWSVLSVALLTAINLGITAAGTKCWMLIKFRDHQEEIRLRYCMIPGVW